MSYAAALLICALVPSQDATETALARCLEDAANASTAGQVACEVSAAQSYDRRMNLAYAALLRELPDGAARALREAQRAWIAFRDVQAQARTGFFATRSGTMYAPMEAASATSLVRDRARQLETDLRILHIED